MEEEVEISPNELLNHKKVDSKPPKLRRSPDEAAEDPNSTGFDVLTAEIPDGVSDFVIPDIPGSIEDYLPKGEDGKKIDLVEKFNEEEKLKIFGPAIESMKKITKQYNIDLPDDLLSRIHIIDGVTARKIYSTESEQFLNNYDTLKGFSLPNRQVILNYDDIIKYCETTKMDLVPYLRGIGIHELWHSVAYDETWQSPTTNENDSAVLHSKYIKRAGLGFRPPIWSNDSLNLDNLNEGFTDYLMEKTLTDMGMTTESFTYYGLLGIVKLLIEDFGELPFLEAYFKKDGLKSISDAFDSEYGNLGLPALVRHLQLDSDRMRRMGQGTANFRYSGTRNFILERREERDAERKEQQVQ